MKKLLVVSLTILFMAALYAAPDKVFSQAKVKNLKGVTTMITGISIPVKTDEVSLKGFIKNSFYKSFAIGNNVEPELLRAVNIDGTSIYKFSLFYKGIPVEGAYTVLTVRDGKIDRISNSLGKIDLDVSNLISVESAVKSATTVRNLKNMPSKFHADKIIVRHFGQFVPAYKVRFSPMNLADSRFHIVNAITGKVIKSGNSTYFDGPTNMAKIWEFNPLVSKDLIDVDLPWVAPADDDGLEEDARGFLITESDDKDIRKIKAFNCPNKDEKVDITELVEQMTGYDVPEGTKIEAPICSPTQIANKVDNGSFIYEDCEDGHEFVEANMKEDTIDKCAEISMYYHASKIYSYIRGLYGDIDSKNPFYLQNNDKDRPLNVIGNFTMPDINDFMAIYQGTAKLVPMDNAMFSQDNPMMGDLLKAYGVKGDILIFGQGTKGDFGYDGDVVYHEFGHATIYTAGIVGMEFTDKYGMSNEPGSVHEGIADTFAFIMTDNSCTGEYASKAIKDWAKAQGGDVEMDKEGEFYCMRTALNEYKVFEDFIAEVHWDGQPLLGANWEIYKLIKGSDKETQIHRDNLMKLILKTLYSIGDGDASFKLWADTFMDEVAKDANFKAKKAEIEKILTDRNFFEEVRARSANKIVKTSYVAGSGEFAVTVDGEEVNIAPSYLQFYYDVPANEAKNGLKITATVAASSSGSIGGGTATPELDVYFRKGSAVEYVTDEKVTVLKDGDAVAEGTGSIKTWKLSGIEKGNRYYFQFINTAASAGTLSNISVAAADVEIVETEDSDSEVADESVSFEDDQIPDDEQTTKKTTKSSGCSITL